MLSTLVFLAMCTLDAASLPFSLYLSLSLSLSLSPRERAVYLVRLRAGGHREESRARPFYNVQCRDSYRAAAV
jgi:hypothetical protein